MWSERNGYKNEKLENSSFKKEIKKGNIKTDFLFILAFIAVPKLIAFLTASLFSTGSAPGRARQVGQTWVFASSPKLVEQEQKILVFVLSWVWTSKPITTSNIFLPLNLCKFLVRILAILSFKISKEELWWSIYIG